MASYERTVSSFDSVADATLTPVSGVDTAPRFAAARTVRPDSYNAFGTFAAERQPERPVRVATVPSGRLMDEGGVVVTDDGSLVLESVWDDEHYQRDYAERRRVPVPHQLEGPHASLISLWGSVNYYHFLFECLPRLAVLEAAGHVHVPLIVPDPLKAWQLEMLERVGVARDRLTPFANGHVQAERLLWAASPEYIDFPTPFVARWLRERLLQRATAGAERRLFVRRTTTRRVANEDEVLKALRRHGFEVVDNDRLTVAEQINAYSEARVVVGVHGAGLANAVFAPDMTLLELFQPGFFNPPFFALAGACDWDYWYLTCEPSGQARKGRDRDIIVPLDLLEQTIVEMLGRI